jgi:putative hemolysin
VGRLAGEGVDLAEGLGGPLLGAEGGGGVRVCEQFRRSGVHIALVTDEYGGIEGVVTLNDLMEAIVGELPSLEDLEDPMIVQREDGSWLLDGLLDLGDFRELMEKENLPAIHIDQAAGGFHTLGGFVLHRLGHIPRAGEHFEWESLRFEVVDMDGKRVDKVLVERILLVNHQRGMS